MMNFLRHPWRRFGVQAAILLLIAAAAAAAHLEVAAIIALMAGSWLRRDRSRKTWSSSIPRRSAATCILPPKNMRPVDTRLLSSVRAITFANAGFLKP